MWLLASKQPHNLYKGKLQISPCPRVLDIIYLISFTSCVYVRYFWKSFQINFNVILQYAFPQQSPLPIFSDNFVAFSCAILPEILHSDFLSLWFILKIQIVSHFTQAGWIALLLSSGSLHSKLRIEHKLFWEISIVKPTRCTISQIYFIVEQHSTCSGR